MIVLRELVDRSALDDIAMVFGSVGFELRTERSREPAADHRVARMKDALVLLGHRRGRRGCNTTTLDAATVVAALTVGVDASASLPDGDFACRECEEGKVDDGLTVHGRHLEVSRVARDSSLLHRVPVQRSPT